MVTFLLRDGRNSIRAKSTDKGSITVTQKVLPASAYLFIETMKGNVSLTLPKKINAALDAQTLKGSLSTTIPVTLEQRTTVLTPTVWERLMREAHGTFGKGGAPITIDVTKGNITINGN